MFGLGMQELIIVGIVAVLLFGRKLPDVARSLGTSYREFRSGLSDIQSQVNVNEPYNDTYNSYSGSSGSYDDFDDREEATAPRFEPPPGEPQASDDGAENVTAENATGENATGEAATAAEDTDEQKA